MREIHTLGSVSGEMGDHRLYGDSEIILIKRGEYTLRKLNRKYLTLILLVGIFITIVFILKARNNNFPTLNNSNVQSINIEISDGKQEKSVPIVGNDRDKFFTAFNKLTPNRSKAFLGTAPMYIVITTIDSKRILVYENSANTVSVQIEGTDFCKNGVSQELADYIASLMNTYNVQR